MQLDVGLSNKAIDVVMLLIKPTVPHKTRSRSNCSFVDLQNAVTSEVSLRDHERGFPEAGNLTPARGFLAFEKTRCVASHSKAKLGHALAYDLRIRSGFEPSGLDRPGRLPHQQGLCEARLGYRDGPPQLGAPTSTTVPVRTPPWTFVGASRTTCDAKKKSRTLR